MLIPAVLTVTVAMSALMVGLWWFQVMRHEADVVDLGWTLGLGAAAIFYASALDIGIAERRWLVAAMAGVWSARLGYYLLGRVRTPGEDGRYQDLRARWGDAAQRRFFIFFQAQGLLVVVLSLHFLIAMSSAASLGGWDLLGVAIWAISIAGESLADRQLARFRRDSANRGKVCRDGLWKYSRHPNFFFEWVYWLSYIPLAVASPYLPYAVVAPLLMFLSIRFVTGIPPIEERSVRSRGQAYLDYQATTNAFFPWFPRETS